jgi:hypothetical protein
VRRRNQSTRSMSCVPNMQDDVSLVGQHPDMFKRSISTQDMWESPRPPFEVRFPVLTTGTHLMAVRTWQQA